MERLSKQNNFLKNYLTDQVSEQLPTERFSSVAMPEDRLFLSHCFGHRIFSFEIFDKSVLESNINTE